VSKRDHEIQTTRDLLLHSANWQALASRCDVLVLVTHGPIDLSTVSTAEHAALRQWAAAAAPNDTPAIIRAYFEKLA